MISVKHIPKIKDLAWFLIKYGRSDLVNSLGISVKESSPVSDMPPPEEMAKDLQSLGPTYIKLGQFLSTQGDLIPPYYEEALNVLQDKVDPFSFEIAAAIVEKELKVKIKDAFLEFNTEPIAAGSLSQVHFAILKSGETVAVKIQRPDIDITIAEDLGMLKELAIFLDKSRWLEGHYYLEDRVDSFSAILTDELDFIKEARNLTILRKNLKEFENIVIPRPILDYTTSKVLTMEYISSKKITTLHPLIKMDVDGEKLVKELLQAYFKQLFIDGFVHIDPHPGNIYITDSEQIALLDVGMVDRLSVQFQQNILKLLIYISNNNGEEAADLVIKIGQYTEPFNYDDFKNKVTEIVSRNQDLKWEESSVGNVLFKIAYISGQHNLRLPQKFNTLGKMLLNLDKIGKSLAPDLNFNQFVRENVESLLTTKFEQFFSKTTLSNFSLELLGIVQKLPGKLANFIDVVGKKELSIKVKSFDEDRLINSFEKIANRITLGLILAAMIIAAALLMRVQTEFQILGYPGLAILLFLGALAGGVFFIINILISDRKPKA